MSGKGKCDDIFTAFMSERNSLKGHFTRPPARKKKTGEGCDRKSLSLCSSPHIRAGCARVWVPRTVQKSRIAGVCCAYAV